MMENFLTWDVLTTYASFICVVYMVVEFTKQLPLINKIPTRYWSFIIAISLGSNRLSDFGFKKKESEDEENGRK